MAASCPTARPTTSSAAPPATPRRSRTPKLWLVSALIAFAGCGASEEDRVRDTVETYVHAFADGDGERACEMMAAPQPGCARTIEELHAAFPEGLADRLHDAEVTSVRITGDKATVRLSPSVDLMSFQSLQRIDGEWRVD